ncbi:hypothetical protein Q4I32_001871 [Leishmania shawi]|uniref:Membrane-associated protein n=1 Tax=Leishmania shawi TaxID=5680 RepID=A0AAW3C677_9TRYP
MVFLGHCAGHVAHVCLLGITRRLWRRLPRLPMCAVLLALLLLCSTTALVAAITTITPLLNITPTDKANPDDYYKLLVAQDATIVAGSTTALSSDGIAYPRLNIVKGLRSIFNNSRVPTPLSTSTLTDTPLKTFPADALSELLVVMALLYLDSTSALPFALHAPIPSTYLPTSYAGGPTLVNPSFPNVPITLNMLLLHVSSITETSLDLGTAAGPSGTAPSLSTFVSSLLSATGAPLFSASQPGLSSSYTHSHANVAIVAYIVEQVLAKSTNHSTLSGIGEFLFGVVLPPLQLSCSFLLSRDGHVIGTPDPFPNSCTRHVLNYVARQALNRSGSGSLESYPIQALYFSDHTLFTTSADMAKLTTELLVPGGVYHATIGALMLQNVVAITAPTMSYTEGRAAGLFLFSANSLCVTMYAAISYSGSAPYCHYSSSTVSDSAPPFGLVASGGMNDELAILCVPVVSNKKIFCSIAELSFSDAGCRRTNVATAGSRAVGLAMVSLARLTSEPMPASVAPRSPPKTQAVSGGFVVIGVVATLVVVIVASYLTDYFIQPPPPVKTIAPISKGQINLRSGTALNNPNGDRGAVDGSDRPVSGEFPMAFHENGGNDGGEELYSGADDEVPYLMHSGGPARGGSSLCRHRPLQRRYRDSSEVNSPNSGSDSSGDDCWGDSQDGTDRFPTGSQRPNPNGILRFDAYT